jgi:lipid II:glycine glycyltransferase (peptidoglycan interpeptide bridge formation enzyme)
MIRRSEREGLTYAEGRSDVLLRAFYELLLKTRRRHALPPQPRVWFRAILDCLPDQACIRVASKDGVPVAGTLTLCDRKVMTYKYGVSDAAAHRLGGVQLLLWRTIQDAYDRGCVELDMGRSAIDNLGEITFKAHWGSTCERMTYLRDSAPNEAGAILTFTAKVARRVFPILPDRVLTAAGTVLYSHFG